MCNITPILLISLVVKVLCESFFFFFLCSDSSKSYENHYFADSFFFFFFFFFVKELGESVRNCGTGLNGSPVDCVAWLFTALLSTCHYFLLSLSFAISSPDGGQELECLVQPKKHYSVKLSESNE